MSRLEYNGDVEVEIAAGEVNAEVKVVHVAVSAIRVAVRFGVARVEGQ